MITVELTNTTPTTLPLTYAEAVAAAEAEIAERGADFTYNPGGGSLCTYVPVTDGRNPLNNTADMSARIPAAAQVTGCLVGQILTRTGRMTDIIANSPANVHSLVTDRQLVATPKTDLFLYSLQRHQDDGATDGDALQYAKAAAERRFSEDN